MTFTAVICHHAKGSGKHVRENGGMSVSFVLTAFFDYANITSEVFLKLCLLAEFFSKRNVRLYTILCELSALDSGVITTSWKLNI